MLSKESLGAELNFIHSRIFGFLPSDKLQDRYISVHNQYQAYLDENEQKIVEILIGGNVDLVSLEFYWRFKNSKNILSKKIQIIFYLTEVMPRYQKIYLSQNNDSLAFFKLTYFTLVASVKLFKGFFLFRQLRL